MQKQHVDVAEGRISTLEDRLQTAQRELHRSEKLIQTLETKVETLPNKERVKSLVILGHPGLERNSSLFNYVQQRLPGWLGLPVDGPLELERAVHSGRTPPNAWRAQRPILIQFLGISDRHLVLQAAKKALIQEEKAKLTIDQALPVEVRKNMQGVGPGN